MIICFEGPSAIGKTTLAKALKEHFIHVPEVNLLFQNEVPNSDYWYYEKQVERYQMCKDAAQSSILDGDVFQPLWYNWIYDFPPEFLSLEALVDFYMEQIKKGRLRFPDLYIIFETSLENLQNRRRGDTTRKRRNFEKHLKLIEPQKAYFKQLQLETTINVQFVNYNTVETTLKQVVQQIQAAIIEPQNATETLQIMTDWIQKHRFSQR